MILTFLLAHANCNGWDERSEFIFSRHPELKGELTEKNFKETSIRNGWHRAAKKMKNDALKIAVETAKEAKAELTSNALNNELDMVEVLEEERKELMHTLKELDRASKSYASTLSSLDRVTKMIAGITDTDRIRRQDALADSAATTLYVAERRGELKGANDVHTIPEVSTIITEDDEDSFTI